MNYPPHVRRHRSPYDRQILGVRVRQAETGGLRMVPYRRTLLNAIAGKEIKNGLGQYGGQWRWHGTTVTLWVVPMIRHGWASIVGKHLEITEAGEQARISP